MMVPVVIVTLAVEVVRPLSSNVVTGAMVGAVPARIWKGGLVAAEGFPAQSMAATTSSQVPGGREDVGTLCPLVTATEELLTRGSRGTSPAEVVGLGSASSWAEKPMLMELVL